MPIYSDINGFPESGFPVLADVSDRICLNNLYQVPLRPAGFRIDVVGASRLLGALTIGGALTGVTSLTMAGALAGVTTLGASGTVTLSSGTAPIICTGANAVFSMTGINASIGTNLSRVRRAWLTDLDVRNTPTVSGEPLVLMMDLARYVPCVGVQANVDLGTYSLTAPTVKLTNLTDGYIPYHVDDATGLANSGLFWDGSNLGVGTVVPSQIFEVAKLAGSVISSIRVNSDTLTDVPVLSFHKSHVDTETTVETIDGDYLGTIRFRGTNTTPEFASSAYIRAHQNGAAGTTVPTDIRISCYDDTAVHEVISFTHDGGVHVGGTTTVEDNALLVDGKFGCNSMAVQGAYVVGAEAPAGGTGATDGAYDTAAHRNSLITLVNNIRAALIANGIAVEA